LFAKRFSPIPDELVKEAIQISLDPSNLPALLVCAPGGHECGLVTACLRRLEGWNLNSVLSEYQSFITAADGNGNKQRYINEVFIEMFDLDLIVLPRDMRIKICEE
jgi:tyrosine-protein phosphatase OCA1